MSKLRKSAKGQDCQVRISGHCNRDSKTVVLAHVGKSHMGGKCTNLHATFCCSACHDVIDGRVYTQIPAQVLNVWKYEGMMRTKQIWLKDGLITIES
jgi:hypothetical protein